MTARQTIAGSAAAADPLTAAHEAVATDLAAGHGGGKIADRYTQAVLSLVTDRAAQALNTAPRALGRVAVVAIGAAARGELAPHSDVDLALLCERLGSDPPEAIDAWVRTMVHPLWDAGVRAEVTVHDVDGWLSQADEDLPLCTALLDAELVAGDAALLEGLVALAHERFFGDERDRFLRRLRDEVADRHARYGGTVYVVEPDLKFGPGGLRDTAVVRWCLRATHQSADLLGLADRGAIRARPAARVAAAMDTLLRFRLALRLAAGRAQDRLVFQYQEKLPALLGRLGHEVDDATLVAGLEAVLQDYYRAARDVVRLGRRLCENCLPAQPHAPPTPIDADFELVDEAVAHRGGDPFAGDPAVGLRAVELAVDRGVDLAGETVDAIIDAAATPGAAALAEDPAAQAAMLRMLTTADEPPVPGAMTLLADLGLLERVVPEFGPIRGRMQHEGHHVYTVDEHTLRAIALLKAIARGEHCKDYPLATELHVQLGDPRVLYLATLVHDAGKASGRDQCEAGAEIAAVVARRAGLRRAEVARCVRLVHEHLTMPLLSQKRDMSDPLLIEEFAATVGDRTMLRELYLLSLVDTAQVRPGNLTAWKLTLLDELYLLTSVYLRRGSTERVEPVADGEIAMPERYYATFDAAMQQEHAAMLARLTRSGAAAGLHLGAGSGAMRLTMVARDRPGLLHAVAAALDDRGIRVMAADVFTIPADPPVALDVFRIGGQRGAETGLDPEALAQMEQEIALPKDRQQLRAAPPPYRVPRSRRRRRVKTRISFEVDPGKERTIVEVETLAHGGVLRRITQAFAAEEVEILVARCNTESHVVNDVFYVDKLSPAAQRALEARLRKYLRRT